MQLYHVTLQNLNETFMSHGKICTAPSIGQAVVGLLDLKHPKREIENDGKLYIYSCTKPSKGTRKGKEFDQKATGELIIYSPVVFTKVRTWSKEYTSHLDKMCSVLHELYSLISVEKYIVVASIIAEAINNSIEDTDNFFTEVSKLSTTENYDITEF